MYKNNPQARANALKRLKESDIDHLLDLQLNGEVGVPNLKTLHRQTNQGIGRQIVRQLPRDKQVPIVKIVVKP